MGYVEDAFEGRTLPGIRRVPGQRGCLGNLRVGGWDTRLFQHPASAL